MNLEKRYITYNNVFELTKLVSNNDELEKVISYLRDNNEYITTQECYDAQSGWKGKHIYLEDIDLSVNGYCYRAERLMEHIKYSLEYKEIYESKEYEEYLRLRDKYKKIDNFYNK